MEEAVQRSYKDYARLFSCYLNKLMVVIIIGIPKTSIKNAPTIGTTRNAFVEGTEALNNC